MRVISSLSIALLALLVLASPAPSHAQIVVGVSIRIAPPVLPVYVQPPCPTEGFLWTPGYWSYGPDGYFWVPGTWVRPPQVGVLWTPGYWGWGGGVYAWHGGYWGPHVGFYGGVNYGFGYGGVGFGGGEWRGGAFAYNTAVSNVNVTVVHNTYINRTVVNNTTVNRVAFNGGPGGVNARPTASEQAAEHEQHFMPTGEQTSHEHAASTNRAQLASENHGQPNVAATGKAGEFSGKNVVPARAAGGNAPAGGERPAAYRPPAAGGGNAPGNAPKTESASRNAPANRGETGGGEARPSNNHAAPPAHQAAAQNKPKAQPAKASHPAPEKEKGKEER